jgi:rifampicin phosphotransferase
MELIRFFDGITRGDLALAGGKGANLGEMVRAGLPVPPGFTLLTSAYRLFVQQAGIQAEIERLAGTIDADSQQSLDAASARIRALFDQGTVPTEMARAITEAYAALGAFPVAVRSSATAEDLPDASFAGQQETYLNIAGTEQVAAAVKRCWSSLWTGRALSYRVKNDIAPGDVALAVVVQKLVAADAAGVMFTVDPISGRRDRMVIEGAWGLGESVVSGVVSPDNWVADGKTGAILGAQVATKRIMTVRTAGGTAERPVPATLQQKPVLEAAHVAALVDLGRRTAAHFGAPQDLEWALADGRFYLLQSRPITTLFPLPEPAQPPEAGLRVSVSFGHFQGVLEPITPAGLCAAGAMSKGFPRLFLGGKDRGEAPAFFQVAARRIYVDVTSVLRTQAGRTVLSGNTLETTLGQAVRDLLAGEERLQPVAGGSPITAINKRVLLTMLSRALAALAFPDRARRGARRKVEAHLRSLVAESHGLKSISDRVRFIRSAAASGIPAVVAHTAPLFGPAVAINRQVEQKLKAWSLDPAMLESVGRSLPHNPTTEMDLSLWRLSRTLKAEGSSPRADHPAVHAFLDQYGHRAVREIDLGIERWRENPEQVLHMLSNYMTQGSGVPDPEAHFQAGATAAEEAIAAIAAQVRAKQGAVQAAFIRWLLHRFRALSGIREWHKSYLVRILAIARQVLKDAGADLVKAGRLDRIDDVFFLDFADLESSRDLRDLASRNRLDYERELKRRVVPVLITSEGEVSYGHPPAQEGMLAGTGASAGVYEGVVRIILNPAGARLEPGEILVAPGTDPAWTPLFLTAGALVTETGGLISHGSVVAREYGIPAVVGVPEVTTRLQTGQRIRVDGGSGLILPLD